MVLWCESAHEGLPGLSKCSLEYGAVHAIESRHIVLQQFFYVFVASFRDLCPTLKTLLSLLPPSLALGTGFVVTAARLGLNFIA